ncbi:DUF7239 family protein [Streptomyces nigrescens]
MPDPREARLPKWTQEELRTLRRELRQERQRTEELAGRNPGTNTFLIDYGHKDGELPRNARIAFHTQPDDGRVRQAIQVYIENGKLRIQGDYGLSICPAASNSFTVSLDTHR